MKASLELKIGQRLSMTPQLQQAIRLLQMSSLDLATEIQQAIETNPMLEELDSGSGGDATADSEATGVDRDESFDSRHAQKDTGARTDDQINSDQLGQDSPLDYEAQYDPPVAPTVRNHDGGDAMDFEARREAPITLYDHLSRQVSALHLTDLDRFIAKVIQACIDDGGYLTASIEDICSIVNTDLGVGKDTDEPFVDSADVGVVLKHIQNLDPAGVGARSLVECLDIQLQRIDDVNTTVARLLVSDHLEALAARDFDGVRKALKIDTDTLGEALDIVQGLDARPGNQITSHTADYVIPDVIVTRGKHGWMASLNTHNMPNVRVNEGYASLIKRGNPKEDNAFMKGHLNDARFFIKSVQNRHDTLLRVAREIINRQQQFFDDGDAAMKPLVLADISTSLDLHESTVSRATTQKYMMTPRGVYELKYFFSTGLTNAAGDSTSATAIRSMIRELIDEEPPTKPVSDSKIATALAGQGVKVARRTVAKYRESMNIPASNLRKGMR